MIKLRRFLRDYKKECIIGPLCKLFEAVLELFVPLVMASIIDTGVKNGDTFFILSRGALLITLAAVGLMSALVCQYMASKASQGVGTKLRSELFAHINTLSHAELDRLGTPSLITRITNDVNQVQQSVAMGIRLLTRAPFIIVGALIMAVTVNPGLSLVFAAASVLIALTLYFIMSRSIPIYSKIQKKLDRIGLLSRENLAGSRVIRAFSKQKDERKKMDEATLELEAITRRVNRLSALLSPATYVVTYTAVIAIVWFGSKDVYNGSLLSGDIIALVSYMTQILLAMIVVANLVLLLTKSSACASRINDVFEAVPSVTEKTSEPIAVDKSVYTPKLEFENVTFSYGDGDDELENISFAVKRGSTVGIIGGTGSGKSTVLGLIHRFYDVKSGCVRVDGVDVREYSFAQLRKQMGIVPQRSTLFSGTIRENMRWREPDADDEEITEALKIAQAYDFVSALPKGLDSRVEQGGANFSGGQRQRLCIARAIMGKPELLILDDSFSALDFATDAALRSALRCAAKDITVLIVTQRCSTVSGADMIVVLDDGKIAGFGTHSELMSGCETYRQIYLSQTSERGEAQ